MNFQQHQWLSDNFDNKGDLNNIFFKFRMRGLDFHLSFGEVSALAGDHIDPIKGSNPYAVIPISDLNKFINRMFSTMVKARLIAGWKGEKEKGEYYDDGIITFSTIKDKELYIKLMGKTVKKLERKVTLGYYPTEKVEITDYVQLARRNWHHFMPFTLYAYHYLHQQALQLAINVTSQNRIKPNNTDKGYPVVRAMIRGAWRDQHLNFARAMFLEACACHYLEDCFAGGHLRTPRVFYGTLADAIAHGKRVHDIDNDAQLKVTNHEGSTWNSTGEREDRHRFDDGSSIHKKQLEVPKKAILASVSQLFQVSQQDVSDKDKMWNFIGQIKQYIPRLSIYWIWVKNDIISKLGYEFQKDQVTDDSHVLHFDLGHRITNNKYCDRDKYPQNQVVVADFVNKRFRNFHFFQRLKNDPQNPISTYEIQRPEGSPELLLIDDLEPGVSLGHYIATPLIHRDSNPKTKDPASKMQNLFLPLGDHATKKFTPYPHKWGPNNYLKS